MIPVACLLLIPALISGNGVGGAAVAEEEAVLPRLYDVRWLDAAQHVDPIREDVARRADLPLDDLWLEWDTRSLPIVPTFDELERWARWRFESLYVSNTRSRSKGWSSVGASASDHAAFAVELDHLRGELRRPVRVGWYRVASSAQLRADGVVLDAEEVRALRDAGALSPIATSTTNPGRGTIMRQWTWRAVLVDHDMEELRARPRPDPQVNIQRPGPECVVTPIPEPGGTWDVVIRAQDARAGELREIEFPSGRELMQLPALDWASLATTARVPNGGGVLLEALGEGVVQRWLFVVDGQESPTGPSTTLLRRGRWSRHAFPWKGYRLRPVSPSGGWWYSEAEMWPFDDDTRTARPPLDMLVDEHAAEPSVRPLGVVLGFRDPKLASSARDRAERLARERYPTYGVELRVVRDRAATPLWSERASAPDDLRVRGAVRGGDALSWSKISSRTYLADTDIEGSQSWFANDPLQEECAEGLTAWIRCLPTRGERVHVTTEVVVADRVRPSTFLDVPLDVQTIAFELAQTAGGLPRERSDESFRLELPQQSQSRVRASFLAQPGEWELVGSALLAETADECTVWVRVSRAEVD